ncbi:MAG: thioredoxin family protein [Candidatus Improbicoccus devescovinae]|nr:MAG: thioredoxin family protein [Candidatus Improbicoccus devescovinae]
MEVPGHYKNMSYKQKPKHPPVTLFSTGCPKCKILEEKLTRNEINYNVVTDTRIITRMGMSEIPKLRIGMSILDFADANNWINQMQMRNLNNQRRI